MVTYNIANTEQSISAVSSNLALIAPYVNALTGLPLGTQPIVLDGQIVAHWDLLNNCEPGLESALQTAQQHCSAFQLTVLDALHDFPFILSASTPTIVNNLATIAGVLTPLVNSGATPTAAEQQTIENSLQSLLQIIPELSQLVASLSSPTNTFILELTADHEALFLGSLSLTAAINQVQQTFDTDGEQYVGQPMGQAIINMMGSITKSMIDGLQSILNSVNAALNAGQPTATAVSDFQGIFTTLGTDYSSTIAAIKAAEGDQFVPVLQQLDVQNAQSYWQQVSEFMTETGFAD